ncbi:bulb-type lectin domain-containing protein, partial [Klebsiella pneumoniae]
MAYETTEEAWEKLALSLVSSVLVRNRYVGILYKNIPIRTVVWVANRINPVNDSSGMLMINSTGYLVLISQNK